MKKQQNLQTRNKYTRMQKRQHVSVCVRVGRGSPRNDK